jgi:TetR/AcrR family transcriptional regulator, transcriptional repressor for nem operon
MYSTDLKKSKPSEPSPKAPSGRTKRTHKEAALAREDTREKLVRCGTELLSEYGFHVTGIDEVLRAAGVAKGSFYHFFPSKQAFADAVIQNYREYSEHKLQRFFGNKDRAPLERISDFVEDSKRGMKKYNYKRGCLIGNLGQELGGVDDYFRHKLEEVVDSWEMVTTDCLREALAKGQIRPDADVESLSRFFWIGWEGAVLRAKLSRSGTPLEQFANVFLYAVISKRTSSK